LLLSSRFTLNNTFVFIFKSDKNNIGLAFLNQTQKAFESNSWSLALLQAGDFHGWTLEINH